MPAPAVTATTESVWDRFPEKDRLADVDHDWTLLRFLSLLFDQMHAVTALVDRFGVTAPGESSDLTDPESADAAWLPWLAQIAGIDPTMSPGELRLALLARRFDAGSLRSVRETVEALLGGEKRYQIIPHADGDPWVVRIIADPDDAGAATWMTWDVDYPTWGQLERVATWADLEVNADLSDRLALEAVRPAGVTFDVVLAYTSWELLELTVTSWTQWEAMTSWSDYETGDAY